MELLRSVDTKSQSYKGDEPPTENEHSNHAKNVYSAFVDYRIELIANTLLGLASARYNYFSNSDIGETSPKLGLI